MNINSIGAIKNYQKLDNLNVTRVKQSDNNRKASATEKQVHKDTFSFASSAKENNDYNLKVESIKRQLAEGSYKLDADAIAGKILGGLYL